MTFSTSVSADHAYAGALAHAALSGKIAAALLSLPSARPIYRKVGQKAQARGVSGRFHQCMGDRHREKVFGELLPGTEAVDVESIKVASECSIVTAQHGRNQRVSEVLRQQREYGSQLGPKTSVLIAAALAMPRLW